jgi:hypothetical protein
MEQQTLNIFNAAALVVIVAIALFCWFYMTDQFPWAILLITLILLATIFVNATHRSRMGINDTAMAIAAIAILGFAWFYMRDQFCFAGYLVVLLLALTEYLKLKKWLKDVVSIQVIVHKNEKDEDRKAEDRNN